MTEPIRVGAQTNSIGQENDEHTRAYTQAAMDAGDSPTTVLDDLRADMAREEEIPNVQLAVPARPDYMVEYKPEFDYDLLRLWIKKAKTGKGKDKDEPHMLQLAYAILTHCCAAIWVKGRRVDSPTTGNPLTFVSEELHRIQGLDFPSARASIRKLYGKGSDGHILQVMRRVAEEAGYTDEIDLEVGDTGPLDD